MGLACARRLAASDTLLLADVADESRDKARAVLAAEGVESETVTCEVTFEQDIDALVRIVRRMGSFRSLVHTGGVSPELAPCNGSWTWTSSDRCASWKHCYLWWGQDPQRCSSARSPAIATWIPGVEALLADPLADGLYESVVGALGRPLDSATAYVLAKRGVTRLVERAATPWSARGGRIVAIAPGLIESEMGLMEMERQPIMPVMIDMTPVKRPEQTLPGRPEDIAGAVAFLVSDDALLISGCDLRVDGGLVGAGLQMMSQG